MGWLLFVVAVFAAVLMPTAAQAEPPGRLIYEMAVVGADTKMQGWRGVLYDAAGKPVDTTAEQRVTTPLGEFVNVPCENPWDACGMIRADMAEWMKTHPINFPTPGQSNDWVYRMYVSGEGSNDQLWTSTLLHQGTEIPPNSTPIDTPMGQFRTGGPDSVGWARAGWFPASWREPTSTAPSYP